MPWECAIPHMIAGVTACAVHMPSQLGAALAEAVDLQFDLRDCSHDL